jgi:signal peptidase I
MRWDFPTIMVALVFVCGAIWLLDVFWLAPSRRKAAVSAQDGSGALVEPEMPKSVEYARSFLPVFLIVLILRSFVVEPFRIPSGSMMPTLLVGDFILVNKFNYGIRLPVLDTKIIDIGVPDRGDVVVFRYPVNPAIPFIKRIVGLPGDRLEYRDKTLYVNGEAMAQTDLGRYVGEGSGTPFTGAQHRKENLTGAPHEILLVPHRGALGRTTEWEVPEGHYFVLGDNRDNSEDSRFWGFVPDENLIGRAFFIWFNWDWGHGQSWTRIGNSID